MAIIQTKPNPNSKINVFHNSPYVWSASAQIVKFLLALVFSKHVIFQDGNGTRAIDISIHQRRNGDSVVHNRRSWRKFNRLLHRRVLIRTWLDFFSSHRNHSEHGTGKCRETSDLDVSEYDRSRRPSGRFTCWYSLVFCESLGDDSVTTTQQGGTQGKFKLFKGKRHVTNF